MEKPVQRLPNEEKPTRKEGQKEEVVSRPRKTRRTNRGRKLTNARNQRTRKQDGAKKTINEARNAERELKGHSGMEVIRRH